jgi:hypothetical protein
MVRNRHRLHASLIALGAVWGAVFTMAGTAEAGAAQARPCRPDSPQRTCCVGRPESCNDCCTPSTSLVFATDESRILAKTGSEVRCLPAACQCRFSEPASPAKLDRRTPDGEHETAGAVPAKWLSSTTAHVRMPPALFEAGGHLRRPPYLLTTHLRF